MKSARHYQEENMPIFGRFDNKAKEALDHAQQAAVSMRHRYWGTEHLLIGHSF